VRAPLGLLVSALLLSPLAAQASPVGLWRAKDGGQVRVAACGKALCGFIATTVPRIDPQTGRPPVDKHNPDPVRRTRPLAGVMILIGMTADGPGQWSGQLYNDDDGRIYAGHLKELGQQAIRIEGCSGALCGGEDLTRVK
jgi:uncharacterized protein (DUF2147 family)